MAPKSRRTHKLWGGWARCNRLYEDHLEIDGATYSLNELVQVRPVYHRIIGIPSARLELRFKKKNVRLRGIAAVEDARKIAAYLSNQLKAVPPTVHEVPAVYLSSSRSAQDEASGAARYPEQKKSELECPLVSEPSFLEHSPIISDYKAEPPPIPLTPTKVPLTPTITLGWERGSQE
jgi:hypothetical protein